MLRGLLVLELAKPTRITSIELELLAKSSIAWPEGFGAHRVDINEEHTLFHAETVYFRAGKTPTRRHASIGPGAAYDKQVEVDYDSDDLHALSHTSRSHQELRNNLLPSPERNGPRQSSRRLSVDSSYFQRVPLSHGFKFPVSLTPPYTPSLTPSSPTRGDPIPTNSTLDDPRHTASNGLSSPRSSQVFRATSLPRAPSVEDVPENEVGTSTSRTFSTTRRTSSSRSVSRTSSRPPSPSDMRNSIEEHRGRPSSRSRFTLSSVSSAFMDAVRSDSPAAKSSARDHKLDDEKPPRGRTKEKRIKLSASSAPLAHSKERSTLSKIGDILKFDLDHSPGESNWKEFKKGTYTYPIAFALPANSPPTISCNYGTVAWRLQATVHRPGAFKSKYAAHREVMVITSPTEEDTEDTENIIVERHWEQQLQYLISISGRSFYIGGTIPIMLTLMPLAKAKVHRISVFIEERIDYYTHMKRIARTDPISRIDLLCVRELGKNAGPILPLVSDDVDAFKNSPLYALVTPDVDVSEMASELMGPGPWTFHQDLQLPISCSLIHFTNKNRRSNMVISHQLKVVMRVERGDDLHVDPKTGKRKLFDIVIQTPITILSCRCNPEWTSLPPYSESFDDTCTVLPKCPCEVRRSEERLRRPTALERMASSLSTDSLAFAAETSLVNPQTMMSLRPRGSLWSRSTQYERLISGQESEIGEAPPTYTVSIDLASQRSGR
ncbi:Arrestin-related trafficking adapter 3 [Termitomyces sp. T112]|nr:Arrestin-related trafficking adapter 3 [Termitomyces sp. T112]